MFLVRDWQLGEFFRVFVVKKILDDSEGFKGGDQLLEKLMRITPKMNDEKRELREHVKSCFKVEKLLIFILSRNEN